MMIVLMLGDQPALPDSASPSTAQELTRDWASFAAGLCGLRRKRNLRGRCAGGKHFFFLFILLILFVSFLVVVLLYIIFVINFIAPTFSWSGIRPSNATRREKCFCPETEPCRTCRETERKGHPACHWPSTCNRRTGKIMMGTLNSTLKVSSMKNLF